MSNHKREYVIKCWDDCIMEGCPGHTIRIEANNTSNALTYSKDDESKFHMDFYELAQFVRQVHEMRHWVEIDNLFKGLENTNG